MPRDEHLSVPRYEYLLLPGGEREREGGADVPSDACTVYGTDSIKPFTKVNTSAYKTKNRPHLRNLFDFLTGFCSNFCNISNVNTVNEKRNIHWNVIFIELNIDREMLAVPLLQF